MGRGNHSGHRMRLLKSFVHGDSHSFYDVQLIEILLYFCLPRVDTNPIAHALLDKFKNIGGILNAKEEELAAVPYLGQISARKLMTAIDIINRYDKLVRERFSRNTFCRDHVVDSIKKIVSLSFTDGRPSDIFAVTFDIKMMSAPTAVHVDDLSQIINTGTLSFSRSYRYVNVLCVSETSVSPDVLKLLKKEKKEYLHKSGIDVIAYIGPAQRVRLNII